MVVGYLFHEMMLSAYPYYPYMPLILYVYKYIFFIICRQNGPEGRRRKLQCLSK